jgi:hypothetical protein
MTADAKAGERRELLCALHVHSTWSDGSHTLAELRERFEALGCNAVLITDHAEYFDDTKLAAYVEECARRSGNGFLFVAGLEFGCRDRMHVLGYGAAALSSSDDPELVFEHIERAGGVSVIAHPPGAHFERIESLGRLPDGIEVWNSKYDGRFAPRPETFRLLQRLRVRKPSIRAFYGQDLHWRTQFSGLLTSIRAPALEREALLDALRAAEYEGRHGGLRLPSNGALDDALLEDFGRKNARARRRWLLLHYAKKALGPVGRHLPEWLKSPIRRMF